MIERLRTLRFQIVRGLLVIGLIFFIIFLLQNTGEIRVEFLFWDGNIPSVILILVTTLGGFAAGYLMAWNGRRRWHKRQEQAKTPPPEAESEN